MGRTGANGPAGPPFVEQLEPRLLLDGTISGQLWNDLNGDGIHDAGDPGTEGLRRRAWTRRRILPDSRRTAYESAYLGLDDTAGLVRAIGAPASRGWGGSTLGSVEAYPQAAVTVKFSE